MQSEKIQRRVRDAFQHGGKNRQSHEGDRMTYLLRRRIPPLRRSAKGIFLPFPDISALAPFTVYIMLRRLFGRPQVGISTVGMERRLVREIRNCLLLNLSSIE